MAEPRRAGHCKLIFGEEFVLGDAGEVALEDYARVVTAAVSAEVLREDAAGVRVTAVRLVEPSTPPSAAQLRDVEDFARGLAAEGGGLGLGWA
jgi:hypothetical protein